MRGRILEVDEFIAELWKVHLKVKEEGYVQVCKGAGGLWCCLTIAERAFLWVYLDPTTWSTKLLKILHLLLNRSSSILLPPRLVAYLLKLPSYISNDTKCRPICH
jgi:hypothetical protein